MKFLCHIATLLGLAFLVSGCGSLGETNDDVSYQPNPLVSFSATAKLKKVWSFKGDGIGEQFIKLLPAIADDHIFLTDISGQVVALNAQTGKRLWRVQLKEYITGGMSADFDKLLLGTRNGKVISLNQSDGSVNWITSVSSEVLSVPKSSGNVVVVHSADEKIYGLDHETGKQLWSYQSVLPALTLRGNANSIVTSNLALVGLANGKLIALHVDSGRMLWEKRISAPHGRSELDRLTDIDGDLFVDGGVVYVTAFHGKISAIELNNAQIKWQHDFSSFHGVDEGLGNLYAVDDLDHIYAFDQKTGDNIWEQSDLERRKLTMPTTIANNIVVGDFEGYVHVLSQLDGQFIARKKIDGDGIRSKIISYSGLLYILGNSGRLSAYRINHN